MKNSCATNGSTLAHEIGHYFNLEHTFYAGCSDWDDCDDTPAISTSTFGCPDFPQESCGTIDMTMNFMDYTNDACMNLFTNGQKARMLAAINQYRPNMLNHNLCNGSTNILEKGNDKKYSEEYKKCLSLIKSKNNTLSLTHLRTMPDRFPTEFILAATISPFLALSVFSRITVSPSPIKASIIE